LKEFEEKRKTFNGICRAQPAFIVVPTTPDQISTILVAAKENNMKIRQVTKHTKKAEHFYFLYLFYCNIFIICGNSEKDCSRLQMPYNLQEIRHCSESQPRVFWHYVFKSIIGGLIVKISINFILFFTKDIFLSKFGMLLASKHFYSKVKLKLKYFLTISTKVEKTFQHFCFPSCSTNLSCQLSVRQFSQTACSNDLIFHYQIHFIWWPRPTGNTVYSKLKT